MEVRDEEQGFFRNFVGHLGLLRLKVNQLNGLSRHKLDVSQVKSGLLHVDDPVNTGVPSEVELECLGWQAEGISQATEAKLVLSRPLMPGLNMLNEHDEARLRCSWLDFGRPLQGEPHGVALLELHHGTGFPEDASAGSLGRYFARF